MKSTRLSGLSAACMFGLARAAIAQTIVSADPPADNPYVAGTQPFRDVLQTADSQGTTQGVGGATTPALGATSYAAITVVFTEVPSAQPAPSTITVDCESLLAPATPAACPLVASVNGDGAGPYTITLSGPIPPGARTSLHFAGVADALTYEYLPGDVDFSGSVNGADLIALQNAIADGSAALAENVPRYDINRSGTVNVDDFVRLSQLLYGYNTTQAWGQATVGLAHDAVGWQPTLPRLVPGYTPPAWLADDVQWARDRSPRNKIDDLIDSSSEALFDIVVNFKRAVGDGDAALLQSASATGAAPRRLRYISSIAVKRVSKARLDAIAAMPEVAFIEGQWGFAGALSISVPAICVTGSAGGCPGSVEGVYPWLDGTGVNLAVLDSGVDDPGGPGVTHHAFNPAVAFYDAITETFSNPDSTNGVPWEGHATRVASVALGHVAPEVGYNLRGVAPGAALVDVRVPFCGDGYWLDVVDGLETLYTYRREWAVSVVNMSILQRAGIGCNIPVESDGTDAFSQLIDLAASQGITIVAAAGNDGTFCNTFLSTAAAATRALTVGASDDRNSPDRADDPIATFSNRGPRTDDHDLDVIDELKPEVTAPGLTPQTQGILGAHWDTQGGTSAGGGTSEAAPHVAGVAALVIQARPGINAASVKQAILSTAEPRTTDDPNSNCVPVPSPYPGWHYRWGFGYVDAYSAVKEVFALRTDLTFPTYPPSPAWLSPNITVDPFPVQPGVDTTIKATIRNTGSATAQKVRIQFGVHHFSVSPTSFYDVGTQIVDVPPGNMDVTVHWIPPRGKLSSFNVEIGYGADITHTNNIVTRSLARAVWSASTSSFTGAFGVANTLTLQPDLITFNPTFEEPGAGWTVQLTPDSIVMGPDDPPQAIQVLLTPPAGAPSGATNTVHVAAMIGPDQLGGVSIQAIVP